MEQPDYPDKALAERILSSYRKPRLFPSLIAFVREWSNVRAARKLVLDAKHDVTMAMSIVDSLQRANETLGKSNHELEEQIKSLDQQLKFFQVVDPNAKCPACGHTTGKLQALIDPENQRVVIQHTCSIDGFQWVEDTVMADAIKVWQPTPRNQ